MKQLSTLAATLILSATSLIGQPGGGYKGILSSPCVNTFSQQGFFFNVVGLNDLRIDSISTMSQGCGSRDVIVMYKPGTYMGYETDTAAWTSIDVLFYTPSCTSSCPIPPTVWPELIYVDVMAGDTVAFYIQMTSGTGSFDGDNTGTEGSVVADDGNLQLLSGKSQSGLGIFTGVLDTGVTFQGDIYYTRINIVTAEASPDTICQGGAATLTATGNGLTSLWQPGGILGNNVTVTPSMTTTYTVTAVDSSGCVDSTTVTVHVDTCLEIHGWDPFDITLSPNPSAGRFVIHASEPSLDMMFIIRDLTGRELLIGKLHEGDNLVSLDADPGIYLVELVSSGSRQGHRMVMHR